MRRMLQSIFLTTIVASFVSCDTVQVKKTNGESLMNSARRIPAGLKLDSSGYLYDPADRSCGGFPMLRVATMPGTCLGLVLGRDQAKDVASGRDFLKPRTILQVSDSQFLVLDMGGWKADNGRLFLLSPGPSGAYKIELLKFPLDNPHGLERSPDGFIYLGEKQKISRFHFNNGKIQDWQLVTANLAKSEGYMHPLSQLAIHPVTGDLFVNSGSASDHCYV